MSSVVVFVKKLFVIKALSAEATRPFPRAVRVFVVFLDCVHATIRAKNTAYWYRELVMIKYRLNLLKKLFIIQAHCQRSHYTAHRLLI